MAENTAIEWCDATFNPWWGCQKVSPACDHCYAERDAKRFAPGRVLWGVGSERRTFDVTTKAGEKHWAAPLKWAKTLPAKLGRRPRVFCASMADWLDLDAPIAEFVRLLDTIRLTPELDWLLLSKRIGNWRKRLHEAWGWTAALDRRREWYALHLWIGTWLAGDVPPANIWLGATVVDQGEADRDMPKLLDAAARVRFVSIEPMLAAMDVSPWLRSDCWYGSRPGPGGRGGVTCWDCNGHGHQCRRLHWIIAGGESGPHARPSHPDWFRSLRDQCAAAGVPFLFKQWGEWAEQDGHRPTRTFSMESDIGQTLASRCDGFISKSGEFVRDMDDATTDDPYRGMLKVGKKAAGRRLDGVEHNGFPEVR